MKKILPFILLALLFTYSHAQEANESQEQDSPCWKTYEELQTFHIFEKLCDKYICSYGSHTDKNMRKARAMAYYNALKKFLNTNYVLFVQYIGGDTLQVSFNSDHDLIHKSPDFDKCFSGYYTGPNLYISNHGQCTFRSEYVSDYWIEFANARANIVCDEVIETPEGYKATCMVEIKKDTEGTIMEDFYEYCKKKAAEWFK